MQKQDIWLASDTNNLSRKLQGKGDFNKIMTCLPPLLKRINCKPGCSLSWKLRKKGTFNRIMTSFTTIT